MNSVLRENLWSLITYSYRLRSLRYPYLADGLRTPYRECIYHAWVLYLYLFICHTITIITKKYQRKCRKKWRGGLKETLKLMLIRPPQLQFLEDGTKITATDTK